MKRIQAVLIGLLCSAAVHAQEVNDANAEKREAKNFHGISVSSAFDIYLTQGSEEAVAVSASETKFRDRIKVEVKDGILYVGYESEGPHWGRGNKKLKAYISFRQIDKLSVSGACDVFTSGSIKAENLDIQLSGASDVRYKGNGVIKDLKSSGSSSVSKG